MKKTKKKAVIGKIAAIIMIASICSLTAIPCFADYSNTSSGNSGVRSYPNVYGFDVLAIRDSSYTSYNGVYSTDKYKNMQSSDYAYNYYDPSSTITTNGASQELNARTISGERGSGYEYYMRDYLFSTPHMLRMELTLDNMFLGVENGVEDAYLPLCSISASQSFNVEGYIDDITYSFTYYDRANKKMVLYEDALSTDDNWPLYAVNYENRGIYIRFNPYYVLASSPYVYVDNLVINIPSRDDFSSNIQMDVTTYNYGFYEDIATLPRGVQLLPPSEMTNLFKIVVFNDVGEFANVGDFLDQTLQAVFKAEFFPGLAIGGVLTLILLCGILTFILKLIIGGL